MPASDSSRLSLLVNLLNWCLHLFHTPLLFRCLDSSRTTVSPVHECMYRCVLFLFLMCVSLEGFEHWISDTHTHSRWKLCQYLESPEAHGNIDASIAFCLCICVLLVSVSIYALICSCSSSSESEKGKHAWLKFVFIFQSSPADFCTAAGASESPPRPTTRHLGGICDKAGRRLKEDEKLTYHIPIDWVN